MHEQFMYIISSDHIRLAEEFYKNIFKCEVTSLRVKNLNPQNKYLLKNYELPLELIFVTLFILL